MLAYMMCLAMLAVGVYAMVAKKNLIKVILGFMIVEYAANLYFVVLGWRTRGKAPIITGEESRHLDTAAAFLQRTVDPLPQAMVLISIGIGLGTLLLLVALAVRIYEKYGTFDITEIRKLKG